MSENKEQIVALDVAELEFDRFIDMMDLNVDIVDMDSEDITAFNKQRRRIISAIQKSALIINDDGEAIYTPQHKNSKHKEPITFHERTGASLMAMDGKKKNYDVAKTYAILGNMCKVHPSVFAGLVGSDVKVCEALFALLMD
jgi:hypothetical protein